MSDAYKTGLDKNPANYVPLSPLSFLARAAYVYPHRIATIHGNRRIAWQETYTRCRRLASALKKRGIGAGDTVAVMAPNIPAMFDVHFGVPMAGAVLNTLNTRLDAETLAFMLKHGEARVLLTEREFSPVIEKALTLLDDKPLVIDIDDSDYFAGKRLAAGDLQEEQAYQANRRLGEQDYEAFLEEGDAEFQWSPPADEWDAISLNYTSGTTGNPKGVVYHHRGAYLNALNNILDWGMPRHPVYLWTLPMFHCNGWCFPWSIAAAAGTNVCLRRVDARVIFDLMREHGVTHYCGAPIVHNTLINAPAQWKEGIAGVAALVAGAAPPAAVIEGMERMGFNLTHVYGLTETYGPAAVCAKHPEWMDLTLEVEDVLYRHPAVLEAAVVAKTDDKWGETPCAFVTLKNDAGPVTEQEIIAFCRDRMARFKAPRNVVFGPLPKTSTGKIQKFRLREQAKKI